MKLINNKKGIDYMVLMVPSMILILSLLTYHLLYKVEKVELNIGEYAVSILDVHDQVSKDLLFLDMAAQKAAKSALYRLAQNGGLFEKSCDTEEGIRLWNDPKNPKQMCVPSIQDNYQKYLNKELNKYLITKKIETNYEYFITEDSLHGIALEDWKYNIFLPISRVTAKFAGITVFDEKVGTPKFGEYIIKPSFKVDFTNKIKSLDQLRNDVERMLDLCAFSFNSKEQMDNCVHQFSWNY
ncbi:hypothetical protein HY837_00435, partial [archaeon]|nr:hypothetical protein [archaeon]